MSARPDVGQVLWGAAVGGCERSIDHAVVVTRVGKRWCYFRPVDLPEVEEGRFDLLDHRWPMDSERYGINLRVWTSREACEAWRRREAAWSTLVRCIPHGELAHSVTEADVREAARLLGLLDRFDALRQEAKP